MKKLIIVVVLLVVSQLSAQDFHTRVLIRGAKQFDSSNFGVVGWLVAPDIANAPNKWLSIMGLLYQAKDWNLEVMAGAVVKTGQATKMIDIRSGFGEALFGNTGISMWSNVEWIDPLSKADKFYLYHQVSYSVVDKALTSFIETEDVIFLDENQSEDLSVGVGLVAHVGQQINMIIVHQWHNAGPNQMWFRTVINL